MKWQKTLNNPDDFHIFLKTNAFTVLVDARNGIQVDDGRRSGEIGLGGLTVVKHGRRGNSNLKVKKALTALVRRALRAAIQDGGAELQALASKENETEAEHG